MPSSRTGRPKGSDACAGGSSSSSRAGQGRAGRCELSAPKKADASNVLRCDLNGCAATNPLEPAEPRANACCDHITGALRLKVHQCGKP